VENKYTNYLNDILINKLNKFIRNSIYGSSPTKTTASNIVIFINKKIKRYIFIILGPKNYIYLLLINKT